LTDELPSSYITISSEAYTMVYLENCFDTWLAEAADTADQKVRFSYPRPLWTKDTKKAKSYKGWSPEGYTRYNELMKALKIQRRKKDTGKDLEKDFLDDARKTFEKTKTVKVKGRSEPFVELIIEGGTDSEEDDTSEADDDNE
jgi:hypothetical protein